MVMRKTSDAALIQIPEKDLKRCQEAIQGIKSERWSLAYSKNREILLIRGRASAKQRKNIAAELESTLVKAKSDPPGNLIWAWSSGGEERYFPTGDILILFEEGTTEAERKKILGKIKDIEINTHPDVEIKPPSKRGDQPTAKGDDIPGFSGSGARQALKVLKELQKEKPGKHTTERPSELCIPIARVSVPEDRRDEVFDIASQIKALPRVRLATPDFSVLGKNIRGVPQQTGVPFTGSDSVHEQNQVDFAWALIDPSDLAAPPGEFLASKDKVAVVDGDFVDHPDVTYNLIGYDAADQDQDPRTPEEDNRNHGLLMSGIIGGASQGFNETGIAAGAFIIPFRPSWSTEDDYIQVNGQWAYRDYEEYVDRYASNWIKAIDRLYQLSHAGVVIANMSLSIGRTLWQDIGDLDEWMNWWLRDGNYGEGVFAAAAAGNLENETSIGHPASVASVFAVGIGERATYHMLGNTGWGLELVVNDGRWPAYSENGNIYYQSTESGGSSLASAVVTGTVALMKSVNPDLTPDEIKSILRFTTHRIPLSLAIQSMPQSIPIQTDSDNTWTGFGPGYCTEFGWGFLNAHYAVETAWRRRYLPAGLFCVKYRSDRPVFAMIQLRYRLSDTFELKRSGLFWSLTSYSGTTPQRWTHQRDSAIQNVDQAVDYSGLPLGEFTLVGDFDGDNLDEIAFQLDASEFWPRFLDHPGHSLLVRKYDQTDARWNALGGRSPYASGAASPQVVFPTTNPIRGMVTADLKGDGKQCLVSWGNNVVNALQYDEATDTFIRLSPEDYAPPNLSAAIDQYAGSGDIIEQKILKAEPVRIHGNPTKDVVLLVSSVSKQRHVDVTHFSTERGTQPYALLDQRIRSLRSYDPTVLPSVPQSRQQVQPVQPFETSALVYLTTVSLIEYDEATSQWRNVAVSSNPDETHILLDEETRPSIESVHTGNFLTTDNNSLVQVVIHLANDRLYYITLQRDMGGDFSSHFFYRQDLLLEGRISPLRSGSFGFGVTKAQLAWLSDVQNGNRVNFLEWINVSHQWQAPLIHVEDNRMDNVAIGLEVAKGFGFARLDGIRDVIALRMAEPDANTYMTYRYSDGAFYWVGVL